MEHLPHYEKQNRPWGSFERFTLNEPSTVKVVSINAGEVISLQTHARRDEFWKILSGSGTVTNNSTRLLAHSGGAFWNERGAKHRIEAGPEGLQFLEIAFGEFDEQDIKRLEDRYGRS